MFFNRSLRRVFELFVHHQTDSASTIMANILYTCIAAIYCTFSVGPESTTTRLWICEENREMKIIVITYLVQTIYFHECLYKCQQSTIFGKDLKVIGSGY